MYKHVNLTPIILAGGFGTRLSTLFLDIPKVLAPVNGRPFLSYLLVQLVEAGFRKVILCTGYKAGVVEKTFGSVYRELSLTYSREEICLGTGGALRYALSLINTEYVLVLNGDFYINVDFTNYFDWFLACKYEAALVLKGMDDTGRYGRVEIDNDGRVVRFQEKKNQLGSGLINAGVYILRTFLLEDIPLGKPFSLEQEFFPNKLVSKGLYGYCTKNEFIDIGTPKSYANAGKFFASLRVPLP